MRVFITGATGFIGSAIVQDLLTAGHHVLGLARSDQSEQALEAAGAQAHRGALEDVESLKRGAAEADGVIHTAFVHDFSNFAASCVTDQRAVEALGAALAGSNRPLVVTSGTMTAADSSGRWVTERDASSPVFPRKSEEAGLASTALGVRASVVRLPPSVHGDGDRGFVPALIRVARENGFSTCVADGKNRWPAVHRLDAAPVYRLALEKGAAGSIFHAVGDEGVPTREIAEAIAQRLNVPVVSKTPEEAIALLGFIGSILAMDGPTSSKQTQELLGWRPTQPGLIADINDGRYFETRAAQR